MTTQKIAWSNLPKTYHLFTKRSSAMVDLSTGEIVRHYSANVKINMVQQAIFKGERYFRTASAAHSGLNLAIKASSFTLPSDDAPLEPSEPSTLNSFTTSKKPRRPSAKQKSSQKSESSKSGESSQTIPKTIVKPKKVGRFKRFWIKLIK